MNRAGAEELDVVGSEPILHDGGGVDRGIVPVEKPMLLGQNRPLLSEMPHEDVEDLHDVRGVDGGAPRDDMHIDEALAVEEGEQHLFGSARLDLGLYWARLSLLNPLLGLFFALRRMVTNHRLVHSHNRVQHGERVALDRFNELRADLNSLLLLIVIQEFGHPPGRLLLQAQIVMKHGVNHQNGRPMGRSKCLDAHPAVIFNGGGDRGDESRGPHCFFAVEMALISRRFSLFHLVDDGINCRFLKGLVPIRSLNSFLNFQIAFTGSGEVGDEVAYARHSTGWEGWQGVTVFDRPGRKTADCYEKGDFRTLALLGPKNIFYIIMQPRTCNGARNKTAVRFVFEFTLY